jgi:hypothetical protein
MDVKKKMKESMFLLSDSIFSPSDKNEFEKFVLSGAL